MAKQKSPRKPQKEQSNEGKSKMDLTDESYLRGTVLEAAAQKSYGIIQIEGPNDFRVPFLPEHVVGNVVTGDSVQIRISVQALSKERNVKIIAPPILPNIPGLWPQLFHPVILNLTGKKGRVTDVRPDIGFAIVATNDGMVYDVAYDGRFRIGDNVIIDPTGTTSARGPFPMAGLVQYCGTTPC